MPNGSSKNNTSMNEIWGGYRVKIAMLIVDMQNGCYEDTNEKAMFLDAAEYINDVSELFREKRLPVVVVQDLEVGDGEGSKAFEVHESVTVKPNDIVVHKVFSNSFWETPLDNILKELGVDFVLISGFAAEYCITFTYGGAVERGYDVSLLQNGIAGMEKSGIQDIQRIRPVIDHNVLRYFINNA